MNNRRYGGIGKPEGREAYSQKQDSTRQLASAYKLYMQDAGKITGRDEFWYSTDGTDEHLYGMAAEMLGRLDVQKPDIGAFVDSIRPEIKRLDATPLFLSALLNATEAEQLYLDGLPVLAGAGYRLGKGKMLVIGKGQQCTDIGWESNGNIFCFGKADTVAAYAEDGIAFNFGDVQYLSLGSKDGISVNFSSSLWSLGKGTDGGAYFNYGRAGKLGRFYKNSLCINLGSPDFVHGVYDNVSRISAVEEAMYIDLRSNAFFDVKRGAMYPIKFKPEEGFFNEMKKELEKFSYLKDTTPECAMHVDCEAIRKGLSEIAGHARERIRSAYVPESA